MRLSLIYPGGKGTQMLQSALARSLARTLVANGLNHFIGKSINYSLSLHTWLRERVLASALLINSRDSALIIPITSAAVIEIGNDAEPQPRPTPYRPPGAARQSRPPLNLIGSLARSLALLRLRPLTRRLRFCRMPARRGMGLRSPISILSLHFQNTFRHHFQHFNEFCSVEFEIRN